MRGGAGADERREDRRVADVRGEALLAEIPQPTEAEIAEALGGNLCRCGSYVKIVDAVRRAAAELAGQA